MKVTDSSSCLAAGKCFPPGFRFHPTDEELILYYLKRKICRRQLRLDIIGVTDVYKWDPDELPGQSKLKTGDRQWFFFSHRDRKYPNGGRSNRATMHGYWKATGKDRTINCNSRSVGLKKTLVYYKGRAPSGERTDWVMHEYTLDEEELKRCPAQEYYALYKVYKKSGPGPKNGEQYGAPFNEEEWVEDEVLEVNGLFVPEKPVQEHTPTVHVDTNTRAKDQQDPLLNGLDEFLNKIADEPQLVQPLAYAYDTLAGQEETQSTVFDYSIEVNAPNQILPLHPNYKQYGVQPSFDITHSATSQLQAYEMSEVTSVPNVFAQQPQVSEDDLFEDFLEMDDLIGPQPTVQSFDNPVQNQQFDEFDGLGVVDFYPDPAMFMCEIGPGEGEHIPQPYMTAVANGMEHLGSQIYSSNIENQVVNYQPEPHFVDARSYLFTQSEPTHGEISPSYQEIFGQMDGFSRPCHLPNGKNSRALLGRGVFEPSFKISSTNKVGTYFLLILGNLLIFLVAILGVVCEGDPAKLTSEANQIPQVKGDDGTDSWFSSALWSFVESIPTTPASASESSALVNRAFERMSSFSRGRINVHTTKDAPGKNKPTCSRRSASSIRGVICFSILGVLCAILWVFIGTSVEVMGRYITSS